jgi:hypothetical protein
MESNYVAVNVGDGILSDRDPHDPCERCGIEFKITIHTMFREP